MDAQAYPTTTVVGFPAKVPNAFFSGWFPLSPNPLMLGTQFLCGGGRRRMKGKQSIAHPWAPIDARLSDLGLERLHVPADGACQFHSVAASCSHSHSELRFLATSFIQSSPDDFASYIPGSLEKYVQHMRKPSTWGDHVTSHALSCVLQRPIKVACTEGVTVVGPDVLPEGVLPIWVAYNGIHYDAVLPHTVELITASFHADPSQRRFTLSPSTGCATSILCSDGLSFVTCNITSLKKNLSLVAGLGDIIGFQECRHTALSVSVLSSKLAAAAAGSMVWLATVPVALLCRFRVLWISWCI